MKIKWLGHAAFMITSSEGTRIINDPYTPNSELNYRPISESADLVTISHDHGDHANYATVKGNPQVIRKEGLGKYRGIEFKGIASYHDSVQGKRIGKNIIFCFTVDGVRICHLGDLGHELSEQQIAEIKPVDILCIPVGGNFTIDARQATAVAISLEPKIIIPMHYRNDKCLIPVASVDEFLKNKQNVRRPSSSEIEFTKDSLPATAEIIVLQHAL